MKKKEWMKVWYDQEILESPPPSSGRELSYLCTQKEARKSEHLRLAVMKWSFSNMGVAAWRLTDASGAAGETVSGA